MGTVTVTPQPDTTPQPQPVQQATTAQVSADPQQQAQVQGQQIDPTQTTPPPSDGQYSNVGQKVLHSVLGALGGTADVQYVKDPNGGPPIASVVKPGAGTQWKRILAGALTGMAAGAGAPAGPNHLGAALSAGMQAGTAQQDRQNVLSQQVRSNAMGDYNEQQKSQLQSAQMASLNQENSLNSFKLGRAQIQAQYDDADRETEFTKFVQSSGGHIIGSVEMPLDADGKPAGTYTDGLMKLQKQVPDLLQQQAAGNVFSTTHVNAQGKIDGRTYALVTPQWKDQVSTADTPYYTMVPPSKPGDAPTFEKQTIPKGGMKNGEIANFLQAGNAQVQSLYQDEYNQHQEGLRQQDTQQHEDARETMRNRTELTKANIAAGVRSGDDVAGSPDGDIVKGMLDGSIDITKTASIRNNRRETLIREAKQADPNWNMQTYGTKMKTRQDFADGKSAEQIQSFGTFLGHAMDLSNSVNLLRNTNSPFINRPLNYLKTQTGNPQIAGIVAQTEATRSEFQEFLNSNRALHESDKEEGQKIINTDMSPAQMQGAIKQFAATAGIRMTELNEKYKRTMGTNVPGILDDQTTAALHHFGQDHFIQAMSGGGTAQAAAPQQQPQQQQSAAIPPPPSGTPANYVPFRDSTRAVHYVDPARFADAQKIDPKATLLQRPQ